MDIRRTATVIERFLDDVDENELVSRLASVANAVKDWASQTNEATAEAYSTAIESLEDAVSNTSSQDLQPISFKILTELGGDKFVGAAPFTAVREIVNGSSGPAAAKNQVNAYRSEFEGFVSRLRTLQATLGELGIERHSLLDTAEIGVIIPSSEVSADVKSSQVAIKKWSRAIENIADATGCSRDSVTLVEVERGSLVVVFGATYVGAKTFFYIANSCLDFYSKILDIRIKSRELKGLGISDAKTQAVLDEVDELVESKLAAIVSEVVKELKEEIARTENEREALLKDAARHILSEIDKGTQVEVDFPRLAASDIGVDEINVEHPIDEQRLRHYANTWRTIEGDERNVLRLTDGKEEEGQDVVEVDGNEPDVDM